MNKNFFKYCFSTPDAFFVLGLIFLIEFILSGCNPMDNVDPVPPNQGDLGHFELGELKSYFQHDVGSNLIYYDRINDTYDSLVVVRCEIDTIKEQSSKRKYTYENIWYMTWNPRNNDEEIYRNYSGLQAEPTEWKYHWGMHRFSYPKGVYDTDHPVFYYPCEDKTTRISQWSTMCEGEQTIYSIDSSKTYTALVFSNKPDLSWKNDSTRYYWVKQKGLYRKSRYHLGKCVNDMYLID